MKKKKNEDRNISPYEKTSTEIQFILKSLQKNVLFQNLPPSSLKGFVGAFEKVTYNPNDVIVKQGDESIGDYVYLVFDGECIVTVDGKRAPDPYGTLGPSSIFGEMSILYQEPRAATITAADDYRPTTTLFRIYATTFKAILNRPVEDLKTMKQIDLAINDVAGTKTLYEGDIIPQYQPDRLWLWQQMDGTVIPLSFQITIVNILWCSLFVLYAQTAAGDLKVDIHSLFPAMDHHSVTASFGMGSILSGDELSSSSSPSLSLPIPRLDLIHEIWDFQTTLTTFVLTFFVNQAYGFWKETYQIARDIQNRLEDFNLLVSTCVKREDHMLLESWGGINRNGDQSQLYGDDANRNKDSVDDEDQEPRKTWILPPESQRLLDEIGRYSRLYHIFVWSSLAKRFELLTTSAGLERMQSRGIMTAKELDILLTSELPRNQLHYIPLEWMMIKARQAMTKGVLDGDNATKGQLLAQTRLLRQNQSLLESKLAGRMPLAYVHLVQILVDTYVLIAPLALYESLGGYSVFAVAILTFFYTGLLSLAKVFLDPFNNEEDFANVSIFMDLGVLIRESNTGSIRWKNSCTKLPF